MKGNKGKIAILCKNYDAMTDKGKKELLLIGEKYLREHRISKAKTACVHTDFIIL